MPYIVVPLTNKRATSGLERTINEPLISVLSNTTKLVNSL